MQKFVVLWSAFARRVAAFAFPASMYAEGEENIAIASLLKGGKEIAGYTSTLDDRSAFILFRHPDETYLVQCRASCDVTRTPSASLRIAISGSSVASHSLTIGARRCSPRVRTWRDPCRSRRP